MIIMNKNKKVMLSIIFVLLIIVVISSVTYAFILGRTNEENINNNSGKVNVVYDITENITGVQLIPSSTATEGLTSVAVARLDTDSVPAAFNIYITPTSIDGLNISALKWEVTGTNNGEIVYTNNGDFSTAVKDTAITIVDKYELKNTDTTFNIYIWLDASLINNSIDNVNFTANITADTVQITGNY